MRTPSLKLHVETLPLKILLTTCMTLAALLITGCGDSTDFSLISGQSGSPQNASGRPPLARDDSYSILRDTRLQVGARQGLLANDTIDPSDANETTLSLPETTREGGSLVDDSYGAFTYTPPVGFIGVDSFSYRLRSPHGTSVARVSITVAEASHPPMAVDDFYTVMEGQVLSVSAEAGVLHNDDLGTPSTITVTFPSTTQQGGVLALGGNDGSFDYTPPEGVLGPDTFVYTITNGHGSSTAAVTITINEAVTPAWIVDGNNGDDATGDYQTASPFKTIQAAIDAAPEGAKIIVKTGNYSGPINLKNGQSLVWDFS